jgi:ubiquinol-cytochrome c reductase cytochrome b subunit
MGDFLKRTGEWVDSRTGLGKIARAFLLKDIPASAGWPQILGSVALFALFVQVFTGVLLALNFAPTPHEAYSSLRFIVRQIAAGRLIRGLHHWGSSLMIIVTVAHMIQVFLWRAYKKPRELTWMLGVLLLLVILGFGLTGYLLPWDNRAYWGSMVTTRIMGSIPILGSVATHLAGADHGIGAVTFARFYAMHTLILPAAAVLLVTLHLSLVLKHGVGGESPAAESTQKFYPKQVWRDMVAVFIAFALLFMAAAFLQAPLERMADPTDTLYTPRPEWYFLFLFQTLKILSGKLEWIGTVGLPSLTVLALLGLPFFAATLRLDRKLYAIGVTILAGSLWTGLTLAALGDLPKRKVSVPARFLEWAPFPPEEIAGMTYFQNLHCSSCHNLLEGEPKAGPNLPRSPLQHPKQWLAQHFKDASGRQSISFVELNTLLSFAANLTPESASEIKRMSPEFVRGASVYVSRSCSSCHKVNGLGGSIGPALNGLAYRRSRDWVVTHFSAPRTLSPGSVMPPYHFEIQERDALLLYLFSLEE